MATEKVPAGVDGYTTKVQTRFISDGTTTKFYPIRGYSGNDPADYIVTISGSHQLPGEAYTITALYGGSLIFVAPPKAGLEIEVLAVNSVYYVVTEFVGADGTKTDYYPIKSFVGTNPLAYIVTIGGEHQMAGSAYTISAANGGTVKFNGIPNKDSVIEVRSIQSGIVASSVFTADGINASFSPISGYAGTKPANYFVSLDGHHQIAGEAYTISAGNGGTIVFSEVPHIGTKIAVLAMLPYVVPNYYPAFLGATGSTGI
jgi:hypothetical protein